MPNHTAAQLLYRLTHPIIVRLNALRHRRPGHILPFRIPFFRIFYSTTYTALFLLTLLVLAITPASMLWTAIAAEAFQYVFIIGGTYVLTALLAVFIYSSRLYTNRAVLTGVGKSYIPVEEGEMGKSVRKMIATQLERSAIVNWEARPRDITGEHIADTEAMESTEIGTTVKLNPERPFWGVVKQAGWAAPVSGRGEGLGGLQFEVVIAELPHLLEASAVSLAPSDPYSEAGLFDDDDPPLPDAVIVEALRRQKSMGLRDYLTQLSLLGLVDASSHVPRDFLNMYERSRFSGDMTTEEDFNELMSLFATLLEGMAPLQPDIVEQIRLQSGSDSDQASSRAGSVAVRSP